MTMGRHSNAVAVRLPEPQRAPRRTRRTGSSRRRVVLPALASFAALGFVLVSVTSPMSQNQAAAAEIMAEIEQLPTQQLAVGASSDGAAQGVQVVRDGFGVTDKPKPPPPPPAPAASAGRSTGGSAPAAGTPDPGSAKAIAHDMVLARGWSEEDYNCLVALWQKESGWNTFAMNKSSGAYGIPQSLPGSKMASAGADWATNPATQITWGLGYIGDRYGTPCGAWGASQSKGWY